MTNLYLAAPARTPATAAAIATAVARHDAAAEAAGGGVAEVDDAGQLVGGGDADGGGRGRPPYVAIHLPALRLLRAETRGPESQIFDQHLLLAGEEAELERAEDGVHDRLGEADVGIAGPAAGLEAGVRELFAEQLQRHAMLQRDGRGQRKAIHQAADRRSFFSHGDEKFAGLTVRIEADGDVTLVAS